MREANKIHPDIVLKMGAGEYPCTLCTGNTEIEEKYLNDDKNQEKNLYLNDVYVCFFFRVREKVGNRGGKREVTGL